MTTHLAISHAFLPVWCPAHHLPATRRHVSSSKQPPLASASRTLAATAAAAAAAAAILAATPLQLDLAPVPPVHAAAKGGGASFLSASGDVIKDPDSLLRWALPISNKSVRELQTELEAAISDLRGLKWQKVDQHVKKSAMVLNNQSDKILKDIPSEKVQQATDLLANVSDALPNITTAVADKNADKVVQTTRDALRDVASVEALMVNKFPFQVPQEYSNLPQLKGRATVQVEVRKAGDKPFDIEGTIYPKGDMTLVIDGYSAPISAGTFVDLVNKGFYDGLPVLRSDGFIIQTGKPKDGGEGFVDKNGVVRTIPLEVFAKGDKQPTYGITLEDDGRGAEGTVLPFTSYGTLAMAREEFEPNTASSQFFWFLFEPDLTPAGRNLMDGSWAVFGYTTKGEFFLKGLEKGDRIVSAKVVDGLQNLVTS